MDSNISALSILILEDQPFQRMAAEQTVAGLGISRFLTAERSEQALTRLKAEGAVDIVLCDLDVPGMDGIQFIRHLAEQNLARGVIVLSAMDVTLVRTVIDMAIAHGLAVPGHMSKPISRHYLRELLKLYLLEQSASTAPKALTFTEKELEKAIHADQFILYYQPKVLLNSGQMVAVEALARWHHPKLGVVNPVHFIPTMESSGLIAPMTMKMVNLALKQIQLWREQGRNIAIGVNVSAAILNDTSLPDRLIEKARSLNIPPELLNLEITESSLIPNAAGSLETLARFKLHGFSLSIDDFGTGYSSMQQLNRIPFSQLKIDRSFVSNSSHDKTLKAIVEANINLAHNLNMQTVAEGVESLEGWQLLQELNCDLAQGYFIAKPMPAESLAEWERQWLAMQPISPPKPEISSHRQ